MVPDSIRLDKTAYVEICHADITICPCHGNTQPLMPMLRVRVPGDGRANRWEPTILPLGEVAGFVDLDRIVWDRDDPLSWALMTAVLRRASMRDLLARLEPAPADDDNEPLATVTIEAAADLPPPPDLAPQVAASLLIAAPSAPPRLLAHISTSEASTN